MCKSNTTKHISGSAFSEDFEFSIMIPTYQRPELLIETLNSAVNQFTSVKYHICVIDNCNNVVNNKIIDEIISRYDPRIVSLFRNDENVGMFGNWNKCIEISPTELMTILNDDDLLLTNFVDTVFDGVIDNKLLVCAHGLFGRGLGLPLKFKNLLRDIFYRPAYTSEQLLFNYPLLGSLGVVFKKSSAKILGGFSLQQFPISDKVFFINYIEMFGVRFLQCRNCMYRLESNASFKSKVASRSIRLDYLFINYSLNKLHKTKDRDSLYLLSYKLYRARLLRYCIDYKRALVKRTLFKQIVRHFASLTIAINLFLIKRNLKY